MQSTMEALDDESLPSQYRASFPHGDFDRRLFSSAVNLKLMRMALKRGQPVTRQDLKKVHQHLYGYPLSDAPLPEGAVE